MTKFKIKNLLPAFGLIIVVVLPFKTEALAPLSRASTLVERSRIEGARLYFDPPSVDTGVGSVIKVRVLLDSSAEKVNAVGGTIIYPDKILSLQDLSDGNSIINFWIRKPESAAGRVFFQGMIPGGYQKSDGLIFTLTFKVLNSGADSIRFSPDSEVLLNDGKGTAARLTTDNLKVRFEEGAEENVPALAGDTEPPETFSPVVSRTPTIFDGRYFLVFATQDKASGVDYFEISEDRGFFRPTPAYWTKGESPFVLKDQDLRSWISVKAVDKKGNERVAFLAPLNRPFYQQPRFIIISCIIFIFLILLRLLRFTRNDNKKIRN